MCVGFKVTMEIILSIVCGGLHYFGPRYRSDMHTQHSLSLPSCITEWTMCASWFCRRKKKQAQQQQKNRARMNAHTYKWEIERKWKREKSPLHTVMAINWSHKCVSCIISCYAVSNVLAFIKYTTIKSVDVYNIEKKRGKKTTTNEPFYFSQMKNQIK